MRLIQSGSGGVVVPDGLAVVRDLTFTPSTLGSERTLELEFGRAGAVFPEAGGRAGVFFAGVGGLLVLLLLLFGERLDAPGLLPDLRRLEPPAGGDACRVAPGGFFDAPGCLLSPPDDGALRDD